MHRHFFAPQCNEIGFEKLEGDSHPFKINLSHVVSFGRKHEQDRKNYSFIFDTFFLILGRLKARDRFQFWKNILLIEERHEREKNCKGFWKGKIPGTIYLAGKESCLEDLFSKNTRISFRGQCEGVGWPRRDALGSWSLVFDSVFTSCSSCGPQKRGDRFGKEEVFERGRASRTTKGPCYLCHGCQVFSSLSLFLSPFSPLTAGPVSW